MSELTQPSSGFMKGKTRHWFWGALAALLLSAAVQLGYTALFRRFANSESILTVAALTVTALSSGSMFAVLLAYGLCNRVKVYKVLFVILACTQLPAAGGSFLGNFATISLLTKAADAANALRIASAILSMIVTATWIACLIVIVAGKPATGVLRAAAALLAGYLLLSFIYDTVIQWRLSIYLPRQLGAKTYITFLSAFSLMRNIAHIGLSAFFFAAMSFSKRKPRQVAVVAPPPAV